MRGLSKKFLDAMRRGLDDGRVKGYVGWDEHWNCPFETSPGGINGLLMTRFLQEVAEFIVAVQSMDPYKIKREGADVANFAMFLSDYYGDED